MQVEFSGLLPRRLYWYRFFASEQASAIGRSRTAPGTRRIAGAAALLLRLVPEIRGRLLWRSPQACYPPELLTQHRQGPSLVAPCPELSDLKRTLLRTSQEKWLQAWLSTTTARRSILIESKPKYRRVK